MGTEPGDNGIPQRVPVRCTVHPRCHNLKTQVHPRKSRVGGNAEPWSSRPPVLSRGPLSLRHLSGILLRGSSQRATHQQTCTFPEGRVQPGSQGCPPPPPRGSHVQTRPHPLALHPAGREVHPRSPISLGPDRDSGQRPGGDPPECPGRPSWLLAYPPHPHSVYGASSRALASHMLERGP